MKKRKLLFTIMMAAFLASGCTAKAEDSKAQDGKDIAQEQEQPKEEASSAGEAANKEELEKKAAEDIAYQFSLPEKGEEIAVMTTNMGSIKIRFFPEEAPKAVENFVAHAKEGYYDGLIFHRVIEDFMLQGGDPLGNGTGGESIWKEAFADEFSTRLHNFRGALSMANAGADTNGSQFFIVQNKGFDEGTIAGLKEEVKTNSMATMNRQDSKGNTVTLQEVYPDAILEKYGAEGGAFHLDFMHTVFGQVFEGMDVVDAIAVVEKDNADKPVKDVVIEKVEIVPYAG